MFRSRSEENVSSPRESNGIRNWRTGTKYRFGFGSWPLIFAPIYIQNINTVSIQGQYWDGYEIPRLPGSSLKGTRHKKNTKLQTFAILTKICYRLVKPIQILPNKLHHGTSNGTAGGSQWARNGSVKHVSLIFFSSMIIIGGLYNVYFK